MTPITVRVPFTVRQRGGRKVVIEAESSAFVPPGRKPDATMVKALAGAFRWRRMLEHGRYGSVAELGAGEKINPSYVSRVLRLTLLAPDIIDAFLGGRQSADVTLSRLLEPLPTRWTEQGKA